MTQGLLFASDVTPPVAELSVLTCANGEPLRGPHPLCEAETDRGCAEFDRLVAAGVYDVQGFTKNERKAQQRKARAAETSP